MIMSCIPAMQKLKLSTYLAKETTISALLELTSWNVSFELSDQTDKALANSALTFPESRFAGCFCKLKWIKKQMLLIT